MGARLALALAPLLTLGCSPKPAGSDTAWDWTGGWTPPDGPWTWEGSDRLLVTEADSAFQAGSYGVLDPVSKRWIAEGGQAHADAAAVCAGAWLVVINRMGADNLQWVDPATGDTVAQWSTGNGTNPQDAVFWGERAFVSLYEEPTLLVARWDDGAEIARIDLSPWADEDGVPEASHLFVADDRIWVTLERMDRTLWRPAGGSLLLGVDPESLAVVSEIPLGADNPAGRWSVDGVTAWGWAVGAYLDEEGDALALDGGLVRVDVGLGVASAGIVTEEEVGANVFSVLTDGSRGWLATYGEGWEDGLSIWDLANPALETDLGDLGLTVGLARSGDGSVWRADNEGAQVERRAWDDGALEDAVDTTLRPVDLAWCGAE